MDGVKEMSNRSLIEKIGIAIDERALMKRTFAKIHQKFPLYFVLDRALARSIDEVNHFIKLKNKYLPFIRSMRYEKNSMVRSDYIWICWFQGIEKAPELIKVCVHSMRKNFPEKKIVILTDKNISEYVQMPEYIEEKRAKRIIPLAQYSDLLRVELLCKYGGLWVDATVYCTGREQYEEFKNEELFVYRQLENSKSYNPIVCSSWLIYAKKNNPILLQTRDILWEYWKNENKLKDYFLFHMFLSIIAKEHPDDWKAIPMFNNVSPHVMQTELNDVFTEKRWNQIKKLSSFHKLNHHVQYNSSDGTLYNYILKEGICSE